MQIQTNDSKFHDSIRYPSIESQIYDLFAGQMGDMRGYEIDKGFTLLFEGYKCAVEIGKKGVKVSMFAPYEHEGVRFGQGSYPSVKLPYNADVTKKVKSFCSSLNKVQELTQKAQPLHKWFKTCKSKEIEQFLRQELDTEHTTVSYWHNNLFDGLEVFFYIHPKGTAPADGVGVCFEKETKKITPWWNGSTRRRLAHYSSDGIEAAVGKNYNSSIESMKKKIKAVEQVQQKIDSFDPTKSAKFVELLAQKDKADELLKEFQAI